MRHDKQAAFELRRDGKSYKTISRELGIPLGTLAGWFKDMPWSRDIGDRLGRTESLSFPDKLKKIVAANKKRWIEWHESARNEAVVEFTELKNNPLFLAGLMLYWGEGDKSSKNSNVKFANTDPGMIRLYCLFLKKALNVPEHRIKIWLLLYPDLVENVQKNFWSRAIGIPLNQFNKSVYITGRHPIKRLSYGVCNVTVSSGQLKDKVIKWLELYQHYFYH